MTDEQITTEDLYGKSQAPSVVNPDLEYEETPIIDVTSGVVVEAAENLEKTRALPDPHESLLSEKSPSAGNKQGSGWSKLRSVILFIILFSVGVWLSSAVRQFLPSSTESQPEGTVTQQPTALEIEPTLGTDRAWVVYQVQSGKTKKAVPGLTLELPSQVLAPICDGTNCASQGTYLPGGSRFTLAARGREELLPDFRGKKLTDSAGKPLAAKAVVLPSGLTATDYVSESGGTTVGGYSFTNIHGLMVEINDQLSLEINHFSPRGVTVDFAGDEQVFEKIVNTISWANSSN